MGQPIRGSQSHQPAESTSELARRVATEKRVSKTQWSERMLHTNKMNNPLTGPMHNRALSQPKHPEPVADFASPTAHASAAFIGMLVGGVASKKLNNISEHALGTVSDNFATEILESTENFSANASGGTYATVVQVESLGAIQLKFESSAVGLKLLMVASKAADVTGLKMFGNLLSFQLSQELGVSVEVSHGVA